MKVIYDVSVCGVGHQWTFARSGVFRVVENLAIALIDSGQCSLTLSAVEDYLLFHALNYARQSPHFRELPFSYSGTRYHLLEDAFKINERIKKASTLSKIGWKISRKVLRHTIAATYSSLLKRILFDDARFRNADIFHSPFYAIPVQTRKYKQLRTFVTVHDLIPILHPQYFDALPPGEQHPLKVVVDGISQTDWVTCVSQKTKDDLCNYRKDLDPKRVSVTHLGASNWFYPCHNAEKIENLRSKYKIPQGEYVLSVCTLEPRKNLPHLIRSFLNLIQQERLENVNLVLVGSRGWKYESILTELTSAEADLCKRIILTGRVEDEDMAALYSGSLVFVYPSLYEGFGLPLLEAMQCGTPVITSNTSSLPEVVGEAGIMVDPQDVEALSHAMLRLMNDKSLRQQMAEKSSAQAKQFSWERCADQTISAYKTALGQS